MRTLPLLAALVLGCSSPAEVGAPLPSADSARESGTETSIPDTLVAEVEAESEAPAPDAAPEVVDATDSALPDTDPPVDSTPPDTGVVDAGPDTYFGSIHWACDLGAPTLKWDATRSVCRDVVHGFDCFQGRADDGVYRCLPPVSSIQGGVASCLNDQGLLPLTSPVAYVSIAAWWATPTYYIARQTASLPRPLAYGWKKFEGSICKSQTTTYPYADGSGKSYQTASVVPASSFAPL